MASKVHRVEFSKHAQRDFEKFEKHVQVFLLKKLTLLESSHDPFIGAIKLSGTKDKYRVRYGDYRVIFTTDPQGVVIVLVVLKVGLRKDVYR